MNQNSKSWIFSLAGILAVGAIFVSGCGKSGDAGASSEGSSATTSTADLSGEIRIDGSSTVFPISQAVAEEFMNENSKVQVTVSESGTSGGFKKFIAGEIEFAGASRPIDAEEVKAAGEKGLEFIELPIAFDGLTVVVNPKNSWVDHLTVAELKKIWEPNSKVKNWSDVRAGWPAKPIKLFGAGADSGTFDYFTEAIVGEKRSSRKDYTGSEDDNQLVLGVAGEEGALGYFGYAYYAENQDKLKVVPIDNGNGPVAPSPETISNSTYQPLSRPLLMYVDVKAIDRAEVKAFLEFLFANAESLIGEVKYVALPQEAYDIAKKNIADKKTGTFFGQGSTIGLSIQEVLSRESGN
jgi:phosphate transport system substrate-binding protein